jgi:hypothetical protein
MDQSGKGEANAILILKMSEIYVAIIHVVNMTHMTYMKLFDIYILVGIGEWVLPDHRFEDLFVW